MAIDERARHRLHERLEEVLGPDEAAILMEQLPPVGWADVATKRDLDTLEAAFRHGFEANRREHDVFQEANRREHHQLTQAVEAVRKEVHQTRTLLIALFATVVSMAGVAFAAAHLA